MSFKFPIGVATTYNPKFKLFILILFSFIVSCTPLNITDQKNNKPGPKILNEPTSKSKEKQIEYITQKKKTNDELEKKFLFDDTNIQKEITVLLPKNSKNNISDQFINILEMGVYDKNLEEVSFEIAFYENKIELKDIIVSNDNYGKIYIGPINNEDTKITKQYCKQGAIFFSFSSNTQLAGDCIYLVNFFPKNELEQLFSYLNNKSQVALLYPENEYGFLINSMIDDVANNSNAVIVSRASYKEDMSNITSAIKELGKYELRKYELDRQKKILINKKDAKSKKRLKKLSRFKTTTDYDFTHLLISDYGLRLLQVVPLLPFYDIDPNVVKFMGTGVIDDEVFFDEPSLKGAIFPGVEKEKRFNLVSRYNKIYKNNFIRISTLPYDLVGLLNYIFLSNTTLFELTDILNNSNIKFDGVDGKFFFKNNMIERNLDILEISYGSAKKVN